MTPTIDHLVYATPNLESGIAEIEALTGVAAMAGGHHPGLGTRNALVGLGKDCYLEIIGPDLEQADFEGVRPFGIDKLSKGALVTWAARCQGLDQWVAKAKKQGVDLGSVIAMSRETPQGDHLKWALTFVANENAKNVIPFFIDWGESPHPSAACPEGASLVDLVLEHPDLSAIQATLEVLHLNTSVQTASQPGMRAMIECPRGIVELS